MRTVQRICRALKIILIRDTVAVSARCAAVPMLFDQNKNVRKYRLESLLGEEVSEVLDFQAMAADSGATDDN
ncbi:MAG: hypothetical protein IPI26_02290 [Elusimicrobia bacterium]|nr:hypothetical protein [Elusimicrobiota bacterium]